MKILSAEQIREADAFTIVNEPISSVNLMERAAGRCFLWIEKNVLPGKSLLFFCGTGNNGGDGLAIARMLKLNDRERDVRVYIAGKPETGSPDFSVNYNRFREKYKDSIFIVNEESDLPGIDPVKDIVIDAVFGSGINRPVAGFNEELIEHINRSEAIIISIDVPSGLLIDKSTEDQKKGIITADYTLSFMPPKLAFFFPENDKYVGKWEMLDIGISQQFINDAPSKYSLITSTEVAEIVKVRKKFSHKGNYGHALLFCGCRGKMGAAVLVARACTRAGAGLVTSHIPYSGINILQVGVPENMIDPDTDPDIFSEIPSLDAYNVVAAGPGIGKADPTAKALKLLIQNIKTQLILDADALNILSENKTWLSFLPPGTIITPHPKEFERIAGPTPNDYERNEKQKELSVKYGIYIILKGANTAITTPEGRCFFNSTGNPGMATGGSGDVLTGILAGLAAQHYTPVETCILGVFIHGLAGDLAASKRGFEALIANDIIEELGSAFLLLQKSRESIYGIKVEEEDLD